MRPESVSLLVRMALLSLAAAAEAARSAVAGGGARGTFVFLADLHVGEGCATSAAGYALNDTDCYSVRDLRAAVAQVNRVVGNDSLVIVGGDLTSSAQRNEFVAAKRMLDELQSPYIATIGNHDVWSYDETVGDRTPTPRGDALFAEIFASAFTRITASGWGTLVYPNTSCPDPAHGAGAAAVLHAQSWDFRPDPRRFGPALAGVRFLAPDFNTRRKAPPPCPGHSPVGGCGVMGMADLNNITGGSWPWFQSRLHAHASNATTVTTFLVTHQPFRCRPMVPDWIFCFNGHAKAAFRDAVAQAPASVRESLHRGAQLAGHQHRWFSGDAFDQSDWKGWTQWENSAVKGDQFDRNMSSSFSVFHIESKNETTAGASSVTADRWWLENGTTWVVERGLPV